MSATPSATLAPKQDRTPSLLTSGTAIIVYVALVRLVLYFFAGPRYGYFRDELYYLACGEHPAWGYVDQPPLIGWIAWLLQHTIGPRFGLCVSCQPLPVLPPSFLPASSHAN
ncbi:hypothetical protein RBB75_06450 [Tunturibacter empetritectus]|uniref:Glycosyltransferase RgtA/B/C/D-like domain-containing protein n=1 Tax=Tunturiibacter empetritectus TaxID=3069691 RepID=A0AAU7ZHG4_9BACT